MRKKGPPKEAAKLGLKVAEALISTLPKVGGPLAALVELLAIPLSNRKQRWLEEYLAEVVSELEGRVSELSKPLDENEDFLTAVVRASQIAMGTQREEKLAALRNAVRNSALKSAPGEDLQVIFLRLVDELTVSHLRMLQVFNEPRRSLEKSGREMREKPQIVGNNVLFSSLGSLSDLIFHCVPELNGQRELCEQLCRDLANRGLIAQGLQLIQAMSSSGVLTPRTTNLGKQFLKFIS